MSTARKEKKEKGIGHHCQLLRTVMDTDQTISRSKLRIVSLRSIFFDEPATITGKQ